MRCGVGSFKTLLAASLSILAVGALVTMLSLLAGCEDFHKIDLRPDLAMTAFEPVRPYPGPAGPAPFTAMFNVTAGPREGRTEAPYVVRIEYDDGTSQETAPGSLVHVYAHPGEYLPTARACYVQEPRRCTAPLSYLILVTPSNGESYCASCTDANRLVSARLITLDETAGQQLRLDVIVDVLRPLEMLYIEISSSGGALRFPADLQPAARINVPAGTQPWTIYFDVFSTGEETITVTVKASAPGLGLEPLILTKTVRLLPHK